VDPQCREIGQARSVGARQRGVVGLDDRRDREPLLELAGLGGGEQIDAPTARPPRERSAWLRCERRDLERRRPLLARCEVELVGKPVRLTVAGSLDEIVTDRSNEPLRYASVSDRLS
jgi:hypothetical protein